jgi:hypothetical protein
MIRQRISTVVTTMSLVLTMSAASAVLPAATLGATANVQIGGGLTVDTKARAATPTQVSPNNVAGFYLWVKNEDASNLSTFFMNAMSAATPVGAYFSKNGAINTNCPIVAGKLGCSFGTLNSGDVLKIVAAFKIDAAPGTANCKPVTDPPTAPPDPDQGFFANQSLSPVCVDFRFTSNSGNVPGKNKSRGDDYHWYDWVATNVTSDDGAGFPFCNQALLPGTPCDANLLTVLNKGKATRTDVQTTKVKAPLGAFNSDVNNLFGETGIAVHDNFPFSCPSSLSQCTAHEGSGANSFVGQWSQVDVNSEQTFTDYIRIDIEMYGVNANAIGGVVHIWFDGTNWQERDITLPCPTADGPATGQTAECFWASGSGNVADVSIWAHNNGNFRNI